MPITKDHGWDARQVNDFAKRFVASDEGRLFKAFVPIAQQALLTEFVALIAAGNFRPVTVDEMYALRTAVAARLASHHKMKDL